MRQAAEELVHVIGVARACCVLALTRSLLYRHRQPPTDKPATASAPTSPRALSDQERQTVLATLHSERFVDNAPTAIYAELLDEGSYLCSPRTMYRILAAEDEVRERRNQLRHPEYRKPELLATAPNQVWSWDITKLLGPEKWTYYHLYVILDVYSRYVVGWMVASRESAALAERLIRDTAESQNVDPNQLILHSDRGPAMKSQTVAQLLATLGVTRSFTRPYVATDNPFSESQFRTLKYRPDFPPRFGSQVGAQSYCRPFFQWYNNDHYHSGIGLLTPAMVHYGQAPEVCARRQQVLDAAYHAHPERFVRKPPAVLPLPAAVWINPPPKSNDNGDGALHRDTNPQQQVSHWP